MSLLGTEAAQPQPVQDAPGTFAEDLEALRALAAANPETLGQKWFQGSGQPGAREVALWTRVRVSSFGRVHRLEMLQVRQFPAAAARLRALTVLEVTGAFDSLPPLHELQQLRLLKLNFAERLSAFPDGAASLPKLEILEVKNCRSLTTLPPLRLPSLKALTTKGCRNLASMGSIAECKSMTVLDLQNCGSLGALPAGLLELRALRKLDLGGCPRLRGSADVAGAAARLQASGCEVTGDV